MGTIKAWDDDADFHFLYFSRYTSHPCAKFQRI
jgi:hypothetical protein